GSIGVVVSQGFPEASRWQLQPRFHALNGLEAVNQRLLGQRGKLGVGKNGGVDDEVRGAPRLPGAVDAAAAVVGILGDESLPETVDQHTLEQILGRIEGRCDKGLFHVLSSAARSL